MLIDMAKKNTRLGNLLNDEAEGKDLRSTKGLQEAEDHIKRKPTGSSNYQSFQIKRSIHRLYTKEADRRDIPFAGRLIHLALEKYAIENGFLEPEEAEYFKVKKD
jgi:hypothetical protein